MKALIRNEGETVLENNNVPGIKWDTGYPLTEPGWAGGPYMLVTNYVPPKDDEPMSYDTITVYEPDPIVEENEDDYVVIDGKRYSKAELRSLIE